VEFVTEEELSTHSYISFNTKCDTTILEERKVPPVKVKKFLKEVSRIKDLQAPVIAPVMPLSPGQLGRGQKQLTDIQMGVFIGRGSFGILISFFFRG
jgi:hypothetical protein